MVVQGEKIREGGLLGLICGPVGGRGILVQDLCTVIYTRDAPYHAAAAAAARHLKDSEAAGLIRRGKDTATQGVDVFIALEPSFEVRVRIS